MSEKKITPLTGEALKLAQEYGNMYDEVADKMEAIRTQASDDIEAMVESYNDKAKAVWIKLAVILGIDAEATYDNPMYKIDGTYADYGFAAFIEQTPEPHPLAALFGAAPGEIVPITEKVPPKDELN